MKIKFYHSPSVLAGYKNREITITPIGIAYKRFPNQPLKWYIEGIDIDYPIGPEFYSIHGILGDVTIVEEEGTDFPKFMTGELVSILNMCNKKLMIEGNVTDVFR